MLRGFGFNTAHVMALVLKASNIILSSCAIEDAWYVPLSPLVGLPLDSPKSGTSSYQFWWFGNIISHVASSVSIMQK
jgi:hypothetical protein